MSDFISGQPAILVSGLPETWVGTRRTRLDRAYLTTRAFGTALCIVLRATVDGPESSLTNCSFYCMIPTPMSSIGKVNLPE